MESADSLQVHSGGITIARDDTGWSASLDFMGGGLDAVAGSLRTFSDESAAVAVATLAVTASRLHIRWTEPTVRPADSGLPDLDRYELANALAVALGWLPAYPDAPSPRLPPLVDEPPLTVVAYSIVVDPQDNALWHGRVKLHDRGRGLAGMVHTLSSGPVTSVVDALKAAVDYMEVEWRSPEVLLPADGEDYDPPLDERRREEANRQSLRLGWALPYPPLPADGVVGAT